MIKAIIFDFGNVIYGFDNNIFLERLAQYTGKSVQELHDIIYVSSDLTKRYETGLISSDDFFKEIVNGHNLSISRSEFIQAYTRIFAPIQTTLELIKKLKKRYKIALISNTSEWDFEHIIKTSEVYSLFYAVSLSFKMKVMKPDVLIYEDVLCKLKVQGEECVYIDDIEKYVKAANNIGMHGIQYISHDSLISSLKKLNVRIS